MMKTGYIMVEIMDSNPAGQIRIKPLCSNCDGLEVWVKPEDILTYMNYIAEENLKNMPAEELSRDLHKIEEVRRALGRKESNEPRT